MISCFICKVLMYHSLLFRALYANSLVLSFLMIYCFICKFLQAQAPGTHGAPDRLQGAFKAGSHTRGVAQSLAPQAVVRSLLPQPLARRAELSLSAPAADAQEQKLTWRQAPGLAQGARLARATAWQEAVQGSAPDPAPLPRSLGAAPALGP